MTFLFYFCFLCLLWSLFFSDKNDIPYTLILASFISLFEISYIPQITSLLFSSLNGVLITALSLLIPTILLIHKYGGFPFNQGRSFLVSLFEEVGELRNTIQASRGLAYLSFLFFAVIIYSLLYTAIFNHFGWDGEAYHSSAAAWFHQNNKITHIADSIMVWINSYPKNIELISMMIVKLNGSDRFIESYQLLFFLISLPLLYKVFYYFVTDRPLAIAGALIVSLQTVIIRQLRTTYLDASFFFLTCFSIYFLIRCSQKKVQVFDVCMLALSIGYLAHTKGSGLHLAALLILVSLTLILFVSSSVSRIGNITLLLSLSAMVGGGWWLKNYLVYGNPFYPYGVDLGIMAFPGRVLGLENKIDLSDYQGARIVLLYIKKLASINLFFLVFGYPVIPFYLSHLVQKQEYQRLLFFTLPLVVYLLLPYTWIPRYGLILGLPSTIACLWFFQSIDLQIKRKKVRKILYSVAGLLLLIQVADACSPIRVSEWKFGILRLFSPLVKPQEKGNRFLYFEALENVTIGIEKMRVYEDDPHWYNYWGSKWQNRVFVVENQEDLQKIDCFIFLEKDSMFSKEKIEESFLFVKTDVLTEEGQPELRLHVYCKNKPGV